MRRVLTLLAALTLSAAMLSAKDKKADDCYYGPQKGDFALSFGITPTINFIGNMFNGTSSQKYQGISGLTGSYYSGTTISAKYYLSDRMPINATMGVNWYTDHEYAYTEPTTRDNVQSSGSHEIMMMVGTQYLLRSGNRLQPILGANLFYSHKNNEFEKLESDNGTEGEYSHNSPTNTIGLVFNLGVEYFLCKNISLSACVDLGLNHKWTKYSVDDWDDKYSQTTSTRNSVLVGKLGGDIAINFYF